MPGACDPHQQDSQFPSVDDKETTPLQDPKESQRQTDGLCCHPRLLWLGLIEPVKPGCLVRRNGPSGLGDAFLEALSKLTGKSSHGVNMEPKN
jgi:hypothetical protein